VTLDMILSEEDILISWFVIILAVLGVASLFVCCRGKWGNSGTFGRFLKFSDNYGFFASDFFPLARNDQRLQSECFRFSILTSKI